MAINFNIFTNSIKNALKIDKKHTLALDVEIHLDQNQMSYLATNSRNRETSDVFGSYGILSHKRKSQIHRRVSSFLYSDDCDGDVFSYASYVYIYAFCFFS